MLEELRRDLMSKLGYRIAYGEATRLAERFPPADQQSDPLLDQHRHAVRAGHHVVIVGCRLADHVDDGVAALVGDEQAADPLADAEPDPALQADRGGDVDGDRVEVAPVAFLDGRQPCPAGAGQEPALAPGVAPAARPGAVRRARSAAGGGGRGRGNGSPARPHARGRDAPARAARSAPWATRSMPGRSRLHMDQKHDLPPDITDVDTHWRCRDRCWPAGAWRRCGGRTGRGGR